jgi:hypothetical protein
MLSQTKVWTPEPKFINVFSAPLAHQILCILLKLQ